jgi:CBS domain-containing protein
VRIGRDAAEGVFGTSPGLRFLTRGLRERAALVERADPGNLQRTIEEVDSLAALVAVASTFPRAMASLRSGGTEALAVARATAGVVDAITRRALALGMATVGEPPAPWAWLAFGSVARREPGLTPDQDTTIVWDGDDAHDGYFGAVAQTVTETLARVGLDPCRSGVTATTPGWRGPIDRWTERLLAPTGRPSRSVFLLTLALDLRKVAGPLRVDGAARRLVKAARSGARFWRLARLAVEQRPPLGALGGLLTERTQDGRRTVDLKQGGLLAVTDLARLRAIQHGVAATGTVERLRDPAVVVALGEDEARALEEAFATFVELRLDRQAAAPGHRAALDTSVEPAALDPISRIRLRQSFRVVDHVQDGVRRELGIGRAR